MTGLCTPIGSGARFLRSMRLTGPVLQKSRSVMSARQARSCRTHGRSWVFLPGVDV